MPWSKVAILGMVIQPSNWNPYNGYINPYYWVDEFIPWKGMERQFVGVVEKFLEDGIPGFVSS